MHYYFFIFLFGQLNFLSRLGKLNIGSICLPLEDVIVHAGNKALMKVDNSILLITGNTLRILDQQHRPRLIN
jgi:hypothetical protein